MASAAVVHSHVRALLLGRHGRVLAISSNYMLGALSTVVLSPGTRRLTLRVCELMCGYLLRGDGKTLYACLRRRCKRYDVGRHSTRRRESRFDNTAHRFTGDRRFPSSSRGSRSGLFEIRPPALHLDISRILTSHHPLEFTMKPTQVTLTPVWRQVRDPLNTYWAKPRMVRRMPCRATSS